MAAEKRGKASTGKGLHDEHVGGRGIRVERHALRHRVDLAQRFKFVRGILLVLAVVALWGVPALRTLGLQPLSCLADLCAQAAEFWAKL